MHSFFLTAVVSLVAFGGTEARVNHHRRMVRPRSSSDTVSDAPATVPWSPPIYNSTFEQPIDHWNACAGNFSQRYWYNAQYWGGPGYPVIFTTPGETPGDGFADTLGTAELWGVYAQEVQAAMVMVEHRYWGGSIPYDVLDAHALRYLTIEQAIADFARFAQLVELPFDANGSSNALRAPWVFVGGSYSGMLAAWTGKFYPGIFWAFHAISAPVQIIPEFWEYWVPVQQGLPQNCSQDLQRIVAHVDETFASGNETAIAELKELFGLPGLENGDFAVALEGQLGSYEQTQPYFGPFHFPSFLNPMCDSIEGAIGANATVSNIPASGIGLNGALANYAAWFRSNYLSTSSSSPPAAWNTYNLSAPDYTDAIYPEEQHRQWMWLSCNEPTFWSFKVAPPSPQPSIVSRLVNKEYYDGVCARYFPPEEGYIYGLAAGRTADGVNALTGGWDYTNTTRLMWSNGEHDPWRTASVSSPFRPGGPLNSTDEVPVFVIPGGFHQTDLSTLNGVVNADVKAIQEQEAAIMSKWVAEFYAEKNGTTGKH